MNKKSGNMPHVTPSSVYKTHKDENKNLYVVVLPGICTQVIACIQRTYSISGDILDFDVTVCVYVTEMLTIIIKQKKRRRSKKKRIKKKHTKIFIYKIHHFVFFFFLLSIIP